MNLLFSYHLANVCWVSFAGLKLLYLSASIIRINIEWMVDLKYLTLRVDLCLCLKSGLANHSFSIPLLWWSCDGDNVQMCVYWRIILETLTTWGFSISKRDTDYFYLLFELFIAYKDRRNWLCQLRSLYSSSSWASASEAEPSSIVNNNDLNDTWSVI